MSLASTLKTTVGYLGTLITRYTPLDLSRPGIEGIFNHLRIDDRLVTSGQPTEEQLVLVRDAGIRHVINLAPHAAENALPDEAATLAALNIEYTHIPVDFARPTDADFTRFCDEMARLSNVPLLVHCAANMRVSAFVFRYRRDVLGEPAERAAEDLHRVWEPFGVWKDFVAR